MDSIIECELFDVENKDDHVIIAGIKTETQHIQNMKEEVMEESVGYDEDERDIKDHQIKFESEDSESMICQEYSEVQYTDTSSEKRLCCDSCDVTFNTIMEYEQHISIHSNTEDFPSKINNHTHHTQDHSLPTNLYDLSRRSFLCQICDKSFTQKSHLTVHMHIHTGERPYNCAVCNKCFVQKSSLKTHMNTHTGRCLHSCEVCSKSFSLKSHLNEHMRIHIGERPYMCDKSFSQKPRLERDKCLHSSERPHTCKECNKAFTQKSILEAHMRIIHAGERRYSCHIYSGNVALIKDQDLTDILIDNPSFFSKLTYEEKLEVKTKRSKPNLSLKQRDGKFTRHFQKQWYDMKPWLTGSVKKNRLYCFNCLLFSRNDRPNEWSEVGIGEDSLKNFMAKAKKHECSMKHITASVKFKALGTKRVDHALTEATRLSAIKHNEKVDQNRSILKRLISTVCFLSKQELSFRGRNESEDSHNKGNYLEMLDFLAEQEPHLKDHLIHSNVFKGTSPDVQNDLISCITEVINDQISNEVDNSPFVSVQVDETLDVSTKSQLSVILRYANNLSGEIEERFLGFYDVSGSRTAESMAEVLLDLLQTWKISKEKLICQTYDGYSVMAGKNSGVHVIIKEHFPHAMFIHCYAHSLNLVFLHCCKVITQVKIFVANLTGFNSFFSCSSRRSELLIERGFKLPNPADTRWNYRSRSVITILQHYQQLRLALNDVVENEGWDSYSIHQAEGLINVLNNVKFIFFLILYNDIFMFIDELCKILQNQAADITLCNKEIENCLDALKKLRQEDRVNEWLQKSKHILSQHLTSDEIHCKFSINVCDELKRLSYEILDTVIVNFESRFKDFRNIEFFELMDEGKFEQYSHPKLFPEAKIDLLCKLYPFFDKDKLKGELMFIFASEDKRLPSKHLFKYLINNGLKDTLTETVKLLSLMLSIPVTTASCQRNMSTLKRVKTYLRNCMMNERLSNLSTLAIEKMSLKMSSKRPEFLSRVIDVFAAEKDRKIKLVYKRI